ncbi:MAG: tRNA (N(6)-L-threonylcarbamoyladenosine(37)-C(2))-methylthiotransferase MtaB [Clostridia bacterium]|nr:tRNA (N(6)-L-threonylcarbamoyladenosine(37)-C(2))-methylthiotransferase MtaB [Clostridia bacterium]
MNVLFFTLGCKVNQYETQAIKELFLKKQFTCDKNQKADIIVINSCTVTAESDRKTRQLLRRLRRENKNAVIVLTGCMVQAFPEKSSELDCADIIVGNKDTKKLIKLTQDFLITKNKTVSIEEHLTGDIYNTPSISDFSERTRAFMKIEDGCDRFCSYCIIPKARGRVRSRNLEDIKKEALILAEKGYKEIVLVGINLSAYGKDTDFNLCDAVNAVCSVDKIKRVRLGSLEPDHISDDMLRRLKAQKKFCPQFHLSLQSGCDETLKRMNRHYDTKFYYDLIKRIRNIFDSPSITTDVMVGFAGETDDEFNKSLNFVKKVGFARTHIFVYSRRTGTVAAELKSQIPKSAKENRAKLMAEVCNISEKEFLNSQCNGTYPVLFETADNGYIEGYTPNYSRVRVYTDKNLTGKIINVKLIKTENNYCIGEI